MLLEPKRDPGALFVLDPKSDEPCCWLLAGAAPNIDEPCCCWLFAGVEPNSDEPVFVAGAVDPKREFVGCCCGCCWLLLAAPNRLDPPPKMEDMSVLVKRDGGATRSEMNILHKAK